MEAKTFFTFAQKLAQMRDEPALRSAVSRAYYYAAYHFSIGLVREIGFPFEKGAQAHEKIYQYLRSTQIQDAVSAANDLKLLRKRRNEADYELESNEFKDHVSCQIDLARAHLILSQIEKLSREPLRSQLAGGLREYHAKIHS